MTAKQEDRVMVPEKQGMEHPQKQASLMEKVQCGVLILSTHVHKDVISNKSKDDLLPPHP